MANDGLSRSRSAPKVRRSAMTLIPCAGRLDILKSTAATVTLRETITTGRLRCITGGDVILRVEAGGSLLFDWRDLATGLKATAVLAPPVS